MLRRSFIAVLSAFAGAACAPIEAPAREDNVRITLTRGICYGFCPDYTLSITSEGVVTYEGRHFVNVTGMQRAVVPRESAAQLVAQFEAANFENLRDEYRDQVTDLPTYTLTLERGGRRKTVVDYAGIGVGMPRVVRHLEDEVDRVAGSARWVLREGQPVRTAPEF